MSSLSRQTAYEWYLGSEFWAGKRRLVLQRARYICEVCHIRPAAEVHHLTYERVFGELATDLQAVCSICHRNIHWRKPANDNQLPFPFADDG